MRGYVYGYGDGNVNSILTLSLYDGELTTDLLVSKDATMVKDLSSKEVTENSVDVDVCDGSDGAKIPTISVILPFSTRQYQ
jgi:hypothetical protein